MSEKDFSARFGNTPEIPRTDADVIALARRLYPSQEEKRRIKAKKIEEGEVKWCGEHDAGLLFAALKNPAISETTRQTVDAIIADSEPEYNHEELIGHFKFYYTDDCEKYPDDCVTIEDIKETANLLNKWWDVYVTNFTTPLCDPNNTNSQIINIKVYSITL